MNKAPRQHAISSLQKNRGSFVVNRFIQDRLTSITVDTDATVSIVHPDLVLLQVATPTGRSIEVFGKVEILVCLGCLKFDHQLLVPDIVVEATSWCGRYEHVWFYS